MVIGEEGLGEHGNTPPITVHFIVIIAFDNKFEFCSNN
jgi:hypothetical protein